MRDFGGRRDARRPCSGLHGSPAAMLCQAQPTPESDAAPSGRRPHSRPRAPVAVPLRIEWGVSKGRLPSACSRTLRALSAPFFDLKITSPARSRPIDELQTNAYPRFHGYQNIHQPRRVRHPQDSEQALSLLSSMSRDVQ
ncbi:hypothetical protein CERSUDRAFT_99585 [Gelatoporia subvermispora B]|uniref:Uncharacterized protein n=1 Tax=Ceriporiopsis subvermispora (strain B) TaxID=914234 RepID=M2P9P6_CERS8|nr:hypothetical protein CERSUDRAFT_99585 [Gelatoporia subvermispora B]